jgi:hypothetical protein
MPSPSFTIIIPTRDRPDFVRLAVDALKAQSYRDFEVIVSDNALHRPFTPDASTFDGVRFRYIRPPAPLWVTDHWEFAVGHARGRYVGILGDKSLLVPNALARVARVIEESAPDAVSWAYAGHIGWGADVTGHGVLYAPHEPYGRPANLAPSELLDYLLATYSAPNFHANHQLETRGSIYHGVFSSALIDAVRARFGRLFQRYAPDLNAQCAAMQVAKSVVHIWKPLELRLAGPSNGFAMQRVSVILATQNEAAPGGTSPPLIPGISASASHLLVSDLVAISGRPLSPERVRELYRRTAYDLYRAEGWPDRATRRAQLGALERAALRTDPSLQSSIAAEKWKARRDRLKTEIMGRLRRRLGRGMDGLWRRLTRGHAPVGMRRVASAYAALAALDRADES